MGSGAEGEVLGGKEVDRGMTEKDGEERSEKGEKTKQKSWNKKCLQERLERQSPKRGAEVPLSYRPNRVSTDSSRPSEITA